MAAKETTVRTAFVSAAFSTDFVAAILFGAEPVRAQIVVDWAPASRALVSSLPVMMASDTRRRNRG